MPRRLPRHLRPPPSPTQFPDGECYGCFRPATHTHSTGFPCCLACFGSDIVKLAAVKVRYCKKALQKAEMAELMEPMF
jgi:hypothetical protein